MWRWWEVCALVIEIETRWHSGCIGQRRRLVTRAYRMRMSMNKTRCGQNRPHRAEAMIDDACKINEDRGRRAHENSATCIVQQLERSRDQRQITTTRFDIREDEIWGMCDGEDDEKNFDVAWVENGPALGTCYESAAQHRLENTKKTSISRDFFFFREDSDTMIIWKE